MLLCRAERSARSIDGHDGRGPPGVVLASRPREAVRVDVVPAAGDPVDAGRGGALCDAVRVLALAGEDEAALALKVGLVDEAGDEVAQAADLPPLEAAIGCQHERCSATE